MFVTNHYHRFIVITLNRLPIVRLPTFHVGFRCQNPTTDMRKVVFSKNSCACMFPHQGRLLSCL